ncbi:MAG: hypothetical protein LBJ59_03435 [Zoogloeaceae bacterium]|jgi:hypothetical protein|nr:hypothetical protein [Zoogloeaceae bacterium]
MIENIIYQLFFGFVHITAFFWPIAFLVLIFPEIRAVYLRCYMAYLCRKGIYPKSGFEDMEAVRLLVERGYKTMAMRCYRKVTNASLKEAKAYVSTGVRKTVEEERSVKVFFDKFSATALFVFRWCVLLFAIPIVVWTSFVDEHLVLENEGAMSAEGCHVAPKIDASDKPKTLKYYFQFDYWFADYRGHIKTLESERCLLKIMSLLQESNNNNSSAAFVDDKGEVFFILKSKKLSTNHEE